MFLGTSKKGPIFKPVRCVNYSAFRTRFSDDPSGGALAQYVKLFFLNGGTDCWVMRIADGAGPSTVTLLNELGALPGALRLEAKDPGVEGETIRAVVTYSGPQPEVTFNLELFRWEVDAAGTRVKKDTETWRNLSMDLNSPGYAPTFITQNSKLVNAADLNPAPAAGTLFGFSLSGRAVPDAGGANGFRDAWRLLLGSTAPGRTNTFQISVGGRPYINVDLSAFAVTNVQSALTTFIQNAIQTTYASKGFPGVLVNVTLIGLATGRRLRIECAGSNGDVFIRPGSPIPPPINAVDVAVPLMLGTEQGGLEVSGFTDRRPAPNGVTFRAADQNNVLALGNLQQQNFTQMTLESIVQSNGTLVSQIVPTLPAVQTTAAADLFTVDANASSPNGNSDGIREKLAIIAGLINNFPPPPGHFWPWRADVWAYRLAMLPKDTANDNFQSAAAAATTNPALPPTAFTLNVHYYSLGASGLGAPALQVPGVLGSDGTAPLAVDYDTAYAIIDKEVQPDVFNLMVLPPDAGVPVETLYALASIFCQKRRAFLLMDPPTDPAKAWTDAQAATAGISGLRTGVVKDYAAVFFPRIVIDEAGLKKPIGPAGAIAGLFARTDDTRGVWKAPAGTEADLRGVVALEQLFSDGENGMLNPRAINTLRVFPNGIVNWGARTMDGDDDFSSEYKYIPIRRLALFIEESLYRGFKWVVFEPNDEPLWAQIRLNVGAFMHDLFRQGAFQGQKPSDAYFVKCDSETTTQSDRNLGIVNIWVGFAPLKPAEFVILYLQQMAGQIQT
jgi:hypothetical protein